jgi:excisionase family DNA binding protein
MAEILRLCVLAVKEIPMLKTLEAAAQLDSALLTVEDVAKILHVPISWVYERTRSRAKNRVPGFRLGKYWRFRESDVFAWIERQKCGVSGNA